MDSRVFGIKIASKSSFTNSEPLILAISQIIPEISYFFLCGSEAFDQLDWSEMPIVLKYPHEYIASDPQSCMHYGLKYASRLHHSEFPESVASLAELS